MKYKRILLKLSGEALCGKLGGGICPETLSKLSLEVKELSGLGIEIAIVIGGGNIHRGIAELNTIFKPTLSIMDGIETLVKTNEVRHGGKHAELNILFAGTDPVSLDVFGLKLLQKIEPKLANKKPRDIKQIKYALDLNIGNEEYELIELN